METLNINLDKILSDYIKTEKTHTLIDNTAIKIELNPELKGLLDSTDPLLFEEYKNVANMPFKSVLGAIDKHLVGINSKGKRTDFDDLITLYTDELSNVKRLLDSDTRHKNHYNFCKWLFEMIVKQAMVYKNKPTKKEVFSKMKPFAIEYYLKFKDEPWMTADNETGRARKVLKKLNEVFPNSLFYPSLSTIRKNWLNAHFKPHLKTNGGR
jgi:hypothetical protein